MKKLLFVLAFLTITVSSYAQKKGSPKQRANECTEYIAKSMDMNKENAQFLNKTLTAKFTNVSNKVRGKKLSKEEKKAIYKESYEWTKKELKSKFQDEEVKQIFKLMDEFNKSKRK